MRSSDWSSDVCSSDLLHCTVNVAVSQARFADVKHRIQHDATLQGKWSGMLFPYHENRSDTLSRNTFFPFALIRVLITPNDQRLKAARDSSICDRRSSVNQFFSMNATQ